MKKKVILATSLALATLLAVVPVSAEDTTSSTSSSSSQVQNPRLSTTLTLSANVDTDGSGFTVYGSADNPNKETISTLGITDNEGVLVATSSLYSRTYSGTIREHYAIKTDITDGTYSVSFVLKDSGSNEISLSKTFYFTVSNKKITAVSETKPATPVSKVSVTRLYNAKNGNHWFTVDADRVAVLQSLGWNDEGEAFKAPATGDNVYVVTSPTGYYHFTSNLEEIAGLVNKGWTKGSVVFHAATSGKSVYRLYNPNSGTHHFTSNTEEISGLVANGWRNEGHAYYVVE